MEREVVTKEAEEEEEREVVTEEAEEEREEVVTEEEETVTLLENEDRLLQEL